MKSITAERGKVFANAFAMKAFEEAQMDMKKAASSIYKYAISWMPVEPVVIVLAHVICKPVESNAPIKTYWIIL